MSYYIRLAVERGPPYAPPGLGAVNLHRPYLARLDRLAVMSDVP
jgi:hypothetical protein